MVKVIITLFSLLCVYLQVTGQTPDPGTRGNYTVVKETYDLGELAFRPQNFPSDVEIRATVHYPSDLTSGPFPLLVFLHGRHSSCYQTGNPGSVSLRWPCRSYEEEIPSYQGYDYLAEHMASYGYIVISIAANGIGAVDNNTSDFGMNARAQLIQYHLDLWKTYNTTGGAPFGNKFIGKADLNNVGTMGHSRGGEGVIVHGTYNKGKGSPYGINAVLSVGPTNYNRPALTGIPLASLLPYCDGDEPNLGGLHYYDDARYLDPSDEAPKHTILMMGTNHNYFNTLWTPGLFPAATMDDWILEDSGNDDPYCGANASGNRRLSASEQRGAFITYASAFFRRYIGKEEQFAPILEGNDLNPPVSSDLDSSQVYISYHAPNSKRFDINRTDSENSENVNTLSGEAKQNGLVNYDICGDDVNELFCLGLYKLQEPHNHSHVSNHLGLSQLKIQWDSPDDWYENVLPTGNRDLSQYDALQFRAAVNFKNSPQSQSLNFKVQLRDGNGNIHSELVNDHSNALFYSPGSTSGVLPRIVHNMIKIPLSSYSDLDLTNIEAIRFEFNESGTGAIIISDLAGSSSTNSVVTSVNESKIYEQKGKITLYPNPANQILHIKGAGPDAAYQIINAYGAIVMSGQNTSIDVSGLSLGIYFLKTNDVAVGKFMIR